MAMSFRMHRKKCCENVTIRASADVEEDSPGQGDRLAEVWG